jgi:hypothetical protein|tara:strand:+ start:189 stop:431 length:243 start_codon:yes stop_codon:yes gene_type:complete
MNIASLNGAIELAKSQFFNGEEIDIIKVYPDGMMAGLNASKTCVAIFADAGDGELFNASGWNKPGNSDLTFEQIADNLYG